MNRLISFICLFFLLFSTHAYAAQVQFAWDANSPAVTGYRLFTRVAGSYDYTKPVWQGAGITCTVELPDDKQSAAVVRAYNVGQLDGTIMESGDSNEVIYTPKVFIPANPKGLLIQAIDQMIQSLNMFKEYLAATGG